MKADDFNVIVENQLDKCKTILTFKGKEYDSSTADRLHSFKVAANLSGLTSAQALAGMMAKHTVSVYDMCMSGEHYSLEKWDEKITDHINYLLLLRALIEEEEIKNAKNRCQGA